MALVHPKRGVTVRTFGGITSVHLDWPPASCGMRSKNCLHRSSTVSRDRARKTSVCGRSQPSVAHSIALFSQSLRQGHVLTTCA
jgi:hypothetical protein